MTNIQFSHSGDLGDIIYSLPTLRSKSREFNRPVKLTLFDYPGRTAHGMTPEKANRLRPLLIEQDYISEVEWSPNFADSDLNGFRDHLRDHGSIVDAHLATHGFSWEHRIEAWLNVTSPIQTYPVIVADSGRYKNPNFDWSAIKRAYEGKVGFVGTLDEHSRFCQDRFDLPFVKADDLLELARVIAGSKLFIGNQSCPASISHGLMHRMIQVVCPGGSQHHCIFNRMDCVLAWDHKIIFPQI